MYAGLYEQLPLADTGKNSVGARPARRLNRDVPHRSTICLSGFCIDVAGKHHAAALRRQVHAHGVGFIRDVNVMRMRQCRTLPGSIFFLHGLLLFGITLPRHSLYCVCIADHRRLTRPTLCFRASVASMPI